MNLFQYSLSHFQNIKKLLKTFRIRIWSIFYGSVLFNNPLIKNFLVAGTVTFIVPTFLKYFAKIGNFNLSLNDSIAIFSLFAGLVAAYFSYVSINDNRKDKRYEEFKEYIFKEFEELKQGISDCSTTSKIDQKVLLTEVNKVKSDLDAHINIFGHNQLTDYAMRTREELIKLQTKIEQTHIQNETLERLEIMEMLLLKHTGQKILQNELSTENNR